jgi:anoctamin-10
MTAVQILMLKAVKPDEAKVDVKEKAGKAEPFVAPTTENVSSKLNVSRLENQMFAYMVTNQITDTFLEVGLPYILRGFSNVKSGKGLHIRNLVEKDGDDKDGDKAFLHDVQHQASLPEYSLFVDYSEMVTQVR